MERYHTLREANRARSMLWDPDRQLTPLFHAAELGGEAGEALNVVKKLEREQLGLPGSRATTLDLADELADVVIVADLLAAKFNIDLDEAVRRKFNETSRDNGFPVEMVND